MPQILTKGARPSAAGSTPGPGMAPAATNRATRASRWARSRPVRMRSSPTSAASKPWARQRRSVAASRTPDSATTRRSSGMRDRSRTASSGSTSSVRRSRLLMPMRRASVSMRGLQLLLGVRLHERLQAQLQRQGGEPRQLLRSMERGQQQDRVRAGRAEQRQLARIDHELLGQDRQARGGTGGGQVLERAAEPVRLDEHGDHRRAAGLVGACPGRRRRGRHPRVPLPTGSGA